LRYESRVLSEGLGATGTTGGCAAPGRDVELLLLRCVGEVPKERGEWGLLAEGEEEEEDDDEDVLTSSTRSPSPLLPPS
jgi:hypothetical protein